MHTLDDVSPYERIIRIAKSLGSRCLAIAACSLVLCFLSGPSHAQQKRAYISTPASCEVKKGDSTKAKTKLPFKSASTTKTKKASKSKAKTEAKPLVSVTTKAKAEAITSEIASDLPSNVEQEISKFFGIRYRFGGDNEYGIDCSALVKQVYADVFGVSLPRNSSQMSRLSNLQDVTQDELKTGDLVFFGANRKRVNHVGMYLAGGHFLHAARSEGVTISRLDNRYWKSRFMFSKRMTDIEFGEEDDHGLEFEQDLMQDSLISALSGGEAEVRFLDTGIKVNNSLELLLSGFFLNSLEDSVPPSLISESTGASSQESEENSSGIRLAAIFSPMEWFKLIPSLTQSEEGRHETRGNQQKLGLETWMILPTSRVAVFMAAHARNEEDLLDRPLGVSPDWQTMDVALGLHYHLSDSLRFSLWGSHAYSPDAKAYEDSGRRNAPIDEMSFQLNIQF